MHQRRLQSDQSQRRLLHQRQSALPNPHLTQRHRTPHLPAHPSVADNTATPQQGTCTSAIGNILPVDPMFTMAHLGGVSNTSQQSCLFGESNTNPIMHLPIVTAGLSLTTTTPPGTMYTSNTIGTTLSPSVNLVQDSVPPILSITNPVACTVSQATKQKIISGQYVDLATLLQADATEANARHLYINNMGEIVAKEKPTTKIIQHRTVDKRFFGVFSCLHNCPSSTGW